WGLVAPAKLHSKSAHQRPSVRSCTSLIAVDWPPLLYLVGRPSRLSKLSAPSLAHAVLEWRPPPASRPPSPPLRPPLEPRLLPSSSSAPSLAAPGSIPSRPRQQQRTRTKRSPKLPKRRRTVLFALPAKGTAQSHAPNAREVGRIWKTILVADSKLEDYAGFAGKISLALTDNTLLGLDYLTFQCFLSVHLKHGRGKREILCGSCNGAGFLGGFMSTADDTSE
uniref:BSD2 cysteine rich domain-containing protein n=2 Tax=Aegilops tauschii subsp. strangulata TaxID=200361 RepID=A0A453S7R8_AEGTS